MSLIIIELRISKRALVDYASIAGDEKHRSWSNLSNGGLNQ